MRLLGRVETIFSFLRSLHIVLHSDCTNLHPQWCGRVPSLPHPFQDLLFVDCLVITILTSVSHSVFINWTIKGWTPKNWCFWIVVLEKTLESPLNSKEIKPINPKRTQHWIFIGSTDAEAKAPILWPPGKNSDVGKDWEQEEKGATEDKMVGWHHWLNGHEFAQTQGGSEGQRSLACCSPWGHKESDLI